MRIKANKEIRKLLEEKVGAVNVSGISEARVAPFIAEIIDSGKRQCLIITQSYPRARKLAADLAFFVEKNIYVIPSEDIINISFEAKSHQYLEDRIRAISAILSDEECIIIAPINGATKILPPRELFTNGIIKLKLGDTVNLDSLKSSLVKLGYERTNIVEAKGQFGIRGGIIDFFPVDSDYPYRIELFGTEIDSIRTFDYSSQRSIENKNEVKIFPAQIMTIDDESFGRAAESIRASYTEFSQKLKGEEKQRLELKRDKLIEYIGTGTNLQLLEGYIRYFYEKREYIWDYLSDSSAVVFDDFTRISERLSSIWKDAQESFKDQITKGEAVPDELDHFLSEEDVMEVGKRHKSYFITTFPLNLSNYPSIQKNYNVESKQTTNFNGRMDAFNEELKKYAKNGYEIFIACASDERVANLKDYLKRNEMESKVKLKKGLLSAGMEFPLDKLVIFSDNDIFQSTKQRRSRSEKSEGTPIKTFSEIKIGDFVVHENHGIGKFIGIDQILIHGSKKDYLKIKYAGEDMLFIPVEQMAYIQRYIGGDGITPKINKLSSGEWSKTKLKIKAAIEDMAKDLLQLSAERSLEKGFAFSKDTPWQREFEDTFMYEETRDQLRSIREIKRDMEREEPMDRLLCGDVGFGKTEVAARAIFKCLADGKQAAMLVPTTILANQHYHTLKERMETFPFEVEMLSRFRTEKQQQEIIKKIKNGSIDFVVGTHRLLSKDLEFKDLGLLVVDEEQRFGVGHKEAMKQMRKNVDVLSLSATPIPRTLHMSLSGIRDMSIIEEPPEERYPIQTYVIEQDDEIIREAILRELDRDGQVYIVYNRVRGIKRIAEKIKALVPSASIAIGHGQMHERELEDVMYDFTQNKYDILVATTIIESGLDIPNVNTMIILDADKFGLAQLYQLKGRVGRSNRMAYTYLVHQSEKTITENAEKRLKAIKEFTEFGSGFKIAMKDLEIRGAGNLLGPEQSGHMVMIGYELYCKLLDEAISKLSGGIEKDEYGETQVEIDINAYIPNNYISDEIIRLQMYKRIASIKSKDDYMEMLDEIVDRFSDFPQAVENLVKISFIRAMGTIAGIETIKEEKGKFVLNFHGENILTLERLSPIIQEYGPAVLVNAGKKPYIKINYKKETDKINELIIFMGKLLSEAH
ncbi:MAG: transcription-repair coupling factor [Eubacteriales bacterium]